MNKYAIFVASSWNYLPYLNALLNSLEKYKINVDVYLMHWEFDEKYLEEIQNFPYKIIPIEIKEVDHNIVGVAETGKNLFIKQARFHYIAKYGKNYDAICMLDADNFIISENFMNFFDLVKGTNKLIGCEEKYKWDFSEKYRVKNNPVFDDKVKALKFMCSVPIVFDLNKWMDVFDHYNNMAFHSYELKPDNQVKRVGDIYCWSISVYKNHRENDCILLPMHSMTQVHGTMGTFWCGVQKHKNKWYGRDGCEIYAIHGRIGTENWANSQKNWYKKFLENHNIEFGGKIEKMCIDSLKIVQDEWVALNYNSRVKLDNYKGNGIKEIYIEKF